MNLIEVEFIGGIRGAMQLAQKFDFHKMSPTYERSPFCPIAFQVAGADRPVFIDRFELSYKVTREWGCLMIGPLEEEEWRDCALAIFVNNDLLLAAAADKPLGSQNASRLWGFFDRLEQRERAKSTAALV